MVLENIDYKYNILLVVILLFASLIVSGLVNKEKQIAPGYNEELIIADNSKWTPYS